MLVNKNMIPCQPQSVQSHNTLYFNLSRLLLNITATKYDIRNDLIFLLLNFQNHNSTTASWILFIITVYISLTFQTSLNVKLWFSTSELDAVTP
jgi:hypothetical protein